MKMQTMGTILIVSGLVIFASTVGIISRDLFLLLLGAGFMVGYTLSGYRTPLLVLGTCLAAVGIYIGTSDYYLFWMRTPLFFLLLGLAFSIVYLVETILGKNSRWALYPTVSFLGVFGVFFVLRSEYILLNTVWKYWPVLLMALGLWLILVRTRR